MLSSGSEPSASPCSSAPEYPRLHRADDAHALLSPSIQRGPGEAIPAFELKFLVPESLAQEVELWAQSHLQRDAYADLRHGGSYQTTTLYLDTAQHEVFHRQEGYKFRKLRLRRYGLEPAIYLEQKRRRGDRVKKRRSDTTLSEFIAALPVESSTWSGQWFRDRLTLKNLRPACRVTYQRTAFVQATSDGPVRVTLDRQVRGLPGGEWDLSPVENGHAILPDQVILEMKFRHALPELFKQAIMALQLETSPVSKYRRIMTAAGAVQFGSAEGSGANA